MLTIQNISKNKRTLIFLLMSIFLSNSSCCNWNELFNICTIHAWTILFHLTDLKYWFSSLLKGLKTGENPCRSIPWLINYFITIYRVLIEHWRSDVNIVPGFPEKNGSFLSCLGKSASSGNCFTSWKKSKGLQQEENWI